MKKEVSLIGAGLVGSMLACYLAKRGYKVNVYESRPDPRKAGYIGGRSINLALSVRGWTALEKIGLKEEVEKIAIPMSGRMIHHEDGSLAYQAYGKEGQAIYSVSRGDLNMLMMNHAEKNANVKLHFQQACSHMNDACDELYMADEMNKKTYVLKPELLIGADGVFSKVRYAMQKLPGFNFSQTYLDHAYKELHIPAAADGSFQMEKNALHIWPRGHFMLIALPNLDGSFTVTLFSPTKGEDGFDSIKTDAQARAYFQKYFPDALALMPEFEKVFFSNPTSLLCYVKSNPWYHKHTMLIGDAAHGIVPFYGQGMNCGFEDCRELDELLEEEQDNWEAVLPRYSAQRKPNGDAILDLALQNFIEMRDLVGDEKFLLRKKIEVRLAAHFGKKFESQYIMVSFSNLPYSYALNEGREQAKLLDTIMEIPDIENKWDSAEVLQMAEKWIQTRTQ